MFGEIELGIFGQFSDRLFGGLEIVLGVEWYYFCAGQGEEMEEERGECLLFLGA